MFNGERAQVPVAEQKLQERKQRWVRLQGGRKRLAAETEEQSVPAADQNVGLYVVDGGIFPIQATGMLQNTPTKNKKGLTTALDHRASSK